jgi:hypothetical protein
VRPDPLVILLLRIVLISGVVSIAAFIAQYTRLAPWWRSAVGRTIVIKDVLLIAVFIPTIMSLFLEFNRTTSHIAAWLDIVLIGLVTPVMLWRLWIWERIHRHGDGE